MAASVFNARLAAQTDLIKKTTEFDAKLKAIDDRVTLNKSKHLHVDNELNKLKTFDAAYFRSKNCFDGNDGTQNYFVFQPVYKYFEKRQEIKFLCGSQKDCLMKKLFLPQRLLTNLLQRQHMIRPE